MSFSGRTPESLLPRSDSKNPATTCKGITTNGRPCRRALASSSPQSSPQPSPNRDRGILAVLNEIDAAAFYCWQHKDQAENLAQQPEQKTTLYPLKERSSIDTLIDRVGILNLDEEVQPPKKVRHARRRKSGERSTTRRDTLPSGWHDMQSPLMTVPEEVRQDRLQRRPHRNSDDGYGRSNVQFSWTCCLRSDNGKEPRHAQPTQQSHCQQTYHRPPPMTYQPQNPPPAAPVRRKLVLPTQPTQPQPTSKTQTLLSLIPTTLSPQITSSLLAELSRPLSPHDEAGYIYVFWLTPDSDTSPDDETASSLLDDDSHSPMRTGRRDAAIQRYASVHHVPREREKKTILLKIGRAQNVHRRMSQWSKQCGQNITLIRFYPHHSSSNSRSPSHPPPEKVPNVGRVERLIHLELSAKKAVKDKCSQCGREHREWFEAEASRDGLRGVDQVVRRWVNWSTRQAIGESTTSEKPAQKQRSQVNDPLSHREQDIVANAWGNADKSRSHTQARAAENRSGNELGGYY